MASTSAVAGNRINNRSARASALRARTARITSLPTPARNTHPTSSRRASACASLRAPLGRHTTRTNQVVSPSASALTMADTRTMPASRMRR